MYHLESSQHGPFLTKTQSNCDGRVILLNPSSSQMFIIIIITISVVDDVVVGIGIGIVVAVVVEV